MCLVPVKTKGNGFEATLAVGMVNGQEPLAPGDWEVLVVAEVGTLYSRLHNEIILPEVKHARYRRRFGFYNLTIDGTSSPVLRVRKTL